MVFKSLTVVNWRSEGCDATFRCLGGVVTRGSGILRSFGAVGRRSLSSSSGALVVYYLEASVWERSLGMVAEGSVGCSATFGLVDVVLGGLGVFARCSVG